MCPHGRVFAFDSEVFCRLLGRTPQAGYIHDYLTDIDAKTIVLEEDYIDKDYLIDYQEFYCRSYENIGRRTNRLHFFSSRFSDKELEAILEGDSSEKLKESYLGFSISKPIVDSYGNHLVGRTMLKTYPSKTGSRTRFYVTKSSSPSLFGLELPVNSIPFQAQDTGVSACATIAIWTAFQALERVFGLPELSPSQITEMASEFPSFSRTFPQTGGLSLEQMLISIRATGLDVETIIPDGNEIIATAVKAFTFAGIPLIAALALDEDENGEAHGGHAAVITGYQHDSHGKVTELYVHDDQIGPYSHTLPDHSFMFWKSRYSGYAHKIRLAVLLVPIYHKIRLPFPIIYHHYTRMKRRVIQKGYNLELYLSTIRNYKHYLLGEHIKNKSGILMENLPRFIWIERLFEKGIENPVEDDIYDGTAVYPELVLSVDYE
jgi:hypothetical protein